MEATAVEQQPKKRRGRPPKVRPDALEEVIEAPRKAEKPPRPSAPMLAKEIVDFVVSRYDWQPGDWRVVLTTLAYVQRLGRYWSEQTRKQ